METNKELMAFPRYGFDGAFGGDFGLLSDGPYVKLADVTAAISQRSEAVDGVIAALENLLGAAYSNQRFSAEDKARKTLEDYRAAQPAPAPSAAAGEQVQASDKKQAQWWLQGPIIAYASSEDGRANQVISKAQYDNALPKNRVMFDVPLCAAQLTPAQGDAVPVASAAHAVVYPPDGTVSPFTVINLGHGKVKIGDSIHDDRLPALWFGKDGLGIGTEEILNRRAEDGETLAVVTFTNVEGLDVLLEVVNRIRGVSFPDATRQSSADAGDAALELAVSAIYFDDGSKYEGALWNIVRALSPSILELLHADPRAAFYAVKSDIAAQGGKGEKE